MNTPHQDPSRRDWFRSISGTQHTPRTLGDELRTASNDDTDTIKAQPFPQVEIDHREKPDPLPEIRESELSQEQLADLFGDLASCANEICLIGKGKLQRTKLEFDCLMATLESGRIQRTQIRYHWREGYWIDTIEKTDQGYRLVRIRHSEMIQ